MRGCDEVELIDPVYELKRGRMGVLWFYRCRLQLYVKLISQQNFALSAGLSDGFVVGRRLVIKMISWPDPWREVAPLALNPLNRLLVALQPRHLPMCVGFIIF